MTLKALQSNKSKTKAGFDHLREDIDEYAESQEELERREASAEVRKYLELKKLQGTRLKELLAELTADLPGEATRVVQGNEFEIEIDHASNKRTITDKLGLLKYLKSQTDQWVDMVTIPLSVVDDYVTATKRDQFVESERTGNRKVVVRPRVS